MSSDDTPILPLHGDPDAGLRFVLSEIRSGQRRIEQKVDGISAQVGELAERIGKVEYIVDELNQASKDVDDRLDEQSGQIRAVAARIPDGLADKMDALWGDLEERRGADKALKGYQTVKLAVLSAVLCAAATWLTSHFMANAVLDASLAAAKEAASAATHAAQAKEHP